MNLEGKKFVATPDDIRQLVHSNVLAGVKLATSRGLYFRACIGTAQAEVDKHGGDQLKALKAVHARFYPIVQETVITSDIKPANRAASDEKKRRAKERNRRTNFARSAYGTIRRWLKVPGHDLMSLKAATVTKSQLAAETPVGKHKVKPERIKHWIDRTVAFTRQLAKAQPEEARAALNEAVTRLTQELFTQAAVSATTDPAVARAEMRPLRVGRATFWPTEGLRRAA